MSILPVGPVNKELLGQVRDQIALVGDDHCDMSGWVTKEGHECIQKSSSFTRQEIEKGCGMAACIGGWAVLLNSGGLGYNYGLNRFIDGNDYTIRHMASHCQDLLGIDTSWFFVDQWPDKFQVIAKQEGETKGMLAVCDHLLNDFGDDE